MQDTPPPHLPKPVSPAGCFGLSMEIKALSIIDLMDRFALIGASPALQKRVVSPFLATRFRCILTGNPVS